MQKKDIPCYFWYRRYFGKISIPPVAVAVFAQKSCGSGSGSGIGSKKFAVAVAVAVFNPKVLR